MYSPDTTALCPCRQSARSFTSLNALWPCNPRGRSGCPFQGVEWDRPHHSPYTTTDWKAFSLSIFVSLSRALSVSRGGCQWPRAYTNMNASHTVSGLCPARVVLQKICAPPPSPAPPFPPFLYMSPPPAPVSSHPFLVGGGRGVRGHTRVVNAATAGKHIVVVATMNRGLRWINRCGQFTQIGHIPGRGGAATFAGWWPNTLRGRTIWMSSCFTAVVAGSRSSKYGTYTTAKANIHDSQGQHIRELRPTCATVKANIYDSKDQHVRQSRPDVGVGCESGVLRIV